MPKFNKSSKQNGLRLYFGWENFYLRAQISFPSTHIKKQGPNSAYPIEWTFGIARMWTPMKWAI